MYRLDPEKVNEYVMKESKFHYNLVEDIVPEDHTQKFMKNHRVSDLKFIKKGFSQFEKNKNEYYNNSSINPPHNYIEVIEKDSRKYLYELGYKQAYTLLTTDQHSKKAAYTDLNFHFDQKYVNMYPKSCMLGPEPDTNFSKKTKKIGDISFEEETNEAENVKHLRRLSPDNLTEEWLRDNLNSKVQILNLDNCYWISKSLISKLGRMNPSLKVFDIIIFRN